MYGASYILYVAANTCMVRAVLYCTVLRAFSHFHAIYRCFPYSCTNPSGSYSAVESCEQSCKILQLSTCMIATLTITNT